MRGWMVAMAVVALWGTGAWAQVQQTPSVVVQTPAARVPAAVTVESEGEGSAEANPDHLDFWLTRTRTDANVAAAVAALKGFDDAVKKELEAIELTPAEIIVEPAAVRDAALAVVQQAARVRFAAADFTQGDEGSAQVALLCDKLRGAAKVLGAEISGPVYGLADPDKVIQSAVAHAVERAYPAADSAAEIMQTRVNAVERVVIQSVKWNTPPADARETLPSLHRITCTATVRVVYIVTATP